MVTCGNMWLPVVTCGNMWLPVVTCGYLWLPVVTCGNPHYLHKLSTGENLVSEVLEVHSLLSPSSAQHQALHLPPYYTVYTYFSTLHGIKTVLQETSI